MNIVEKIMISIIALEHLFILYIEMFAWTKMGTKIVSKASQSFLNETKAMAENQGLYNGFLVAGLIWSLIIPNGIWAQYIALFFLGCVVVAGIFGAARASVSILWKQAIPGCIAMIVVLLL